MTIILISLFCLLLNIPFGNWRSKQKKFSFLWFVYVHAPVPLVIALRLLLKVEVIYIPLFIAMAVLGQYLGARCQCLRRSN